ncbi:uracil-DNA glycosylase [Caballeronia sp. dw_19]|uniref:uracil-DNA glycosylase n=1 Tax=unclassified Caballeronia TaxID=2646786 RepID=UPI001BD38A55|nr:uracil-DNA glycosylase [Caballeronia sp. dw_19]
MALHKSMLEEFGLGTVWVRRGPASVETSVAVPDQSTDSTAIAHDHAAAEVHRSAPRVLVEEAYAPVARKADPLDTLTALDAALSAAQTSQGNAHQAPPAKIASVEPPVFDDLPWLDDVPPQSLAVSETVDDTAADIATLDWDTLAARVAVCERCRLCERRTNSVFGVGDRDADWMLIGEAPGENEDKLGEPFVGQAGKLLDSMLHAVALSREDNVFIANVIKCRPPGNRNPELDEVARCEPYLKRQVELVKPKLIVALGRFAAQSLLKTEASIASLRGRVHDYQGVPVIVTYHPAYLLRSLPDKAKAWADLCLAEATYRKSLQAADGP